MRATPESRGRRRSHTSKKTHSTRVPLTPQQEVIKINPNAKAKSEPWGKYFVCIPSLCFHPRGPEQERENLRPGEPISQSFSRGRTPKWGLLNIFFLPLRDFFLPAPTPPGKKLPSALSLSFHLDPSPPTTNVLNERDIHKGINQENAFMDTKFQPLSRTLDASSPRWDA